MKKKTARLIFYPTIGLLAAIVVAGNIIAFRYQDVITYTLNPPISDSKEAEKSKAEGNGLAQEIMGEGIVMVKNDNDVLPLNKDNKKVNIFGHNSIDYYYSGTGSGAIKFKEEDYIDLLKAMGDYGVDYNKELISMYERYAPAQPFPSFQFDPTNVIHQLSEPNFNDKNFYSDNLLSDAKNFSDTAIVTIGRRSGERYDAPDVQYKRGGAVDRSRHYLEISTEEEDMLNYVSENFDKVIVLINSTNTFQLDFLKTIPNIDACLIVGTTGTTGAKVIPSVLYGDINPSGHLVDTQTFDFTKNINYNIQGERSEAIYKNTMDYNGYGGKGIPYIDYTDNIYVGYRYYETAYADGVFDGIDNKYGKGYEGVVQYPFGYGLSYTKFDWSLVSVTPSNKTFDKDTKIEVKLNVRNTGKVAGKDVVQLYMTSPYTKGGIEKSAVTLVGFQKTVSIDPGMQQEVTLELTPYDFASYDYEDKNGDGFKGYTLDKGKYELKIMTDAHNLKNMASNTLEFNIDNNITWDKDPVTGKEVKNLFSAGEGDTLIDPMSVDGKTSGENIPYISRSSLPSSPIEKQPARDASDLVKSWNEYVKDDTKTKAWDNATTDEWGNPISQDPVTWDAPKKDELQIGKDGNPTELGYELGANYDDPRWDEVLNQVSKNTALQVSKDAGMKTGAIPEIGKPQRADYDGPIQAFGWSGKGDATGFPSLTVLGQTWNTKLAFRFGLSYAKDMDAAGIGGAYGPACNIHRSPFGGRNFEYFSEDPFLSGKMVAQAVRGITVSGKYAYTKHLVGNETETKRHNSNTWMTEQALREIYLKPFEILVKEGKANAMMTAYNKLGGVWAGGSTALITGVLRGEWNFHGTVITDYNHPEFMNMEMVIRAGGDLGMAMFNDGYRANIGTATSTSPRVQRALRRVVKDVAYTWLNSFAVNREYLKNPETDDVIKITTPVDSWVWWKVTIYSIDLVMALIVFYTVWFTETDSWKKKKLNKHVENVLTEKSDNKSSIFQSKTPTIFDNKN